VSRVQHKSKEFTMNNNTRRNFHKIMIVTATLLSVGAVSLPSQAATAQDLKQDASAALQALYKSYPEVQTLSNNAHAVLVFPKVIKAGLALGGSYGEGVMTKSGHFCGYYNSVSASWGWQAGTESCGYVIFLMNDRAVKHLEQGKGWEFGVGPNVVLVDEGLARNLPVTAMNDDAYAYLFDQQGLVVSPRIEGTKIAPIKKL